MISICITVKNRSRLVIDGRELRLLPNCLKSIMEQGRRGHIFVYHLFIPVRRDVDWAGGAHGRMGAIADFLGAEDAYANAGNAGVRA